MKMFYLQDSRSYLGNSMIWWSRDNKHTTDLAMAREFTFEEAMALHRQRETDIPWPVEYISPRLQLTVDMQHVRRSHLLEHGVVLQMPKPIKKAQFRCANCGGFMGYVVTMMTACPNCGHTGEV